MNDNLKNVYHRILFDKNAPGEAPDQAARQQLQEEFGCKRKQNKRSKSAVEFIMFALMAAIAVLYFQTSDVKMLIGLGASLIIAYEAAVMINLWYYVVHTRLLLVREIKELRLEVAELTARNTPPGE
jgi:hypothetical protein